MRSEDARLSDRGQVTPRFASIAVAALLLFPETASAQAPAAKPAPDCGAGAGSEVVVCGERERSPYRIDPVTLDAIRQKEAADHPDRLASREPPPEGCGTGSNQCSGGTVPLLEPALRVATAVVKAVKGEDWREAFSNGPSDYDRYKGAKRKRSKITVGISAGNQTSTP